MAPEHAKVENQKAFTIEVSEEQAKAIQAALNAQAEEMGTDTDEWMTAEEFVENYLVADAVDFVTEFEPYNR